MIWIAYLAISALVINIFMERFSFLEDVSRQSFPKMVTYSVDRPFAYRVLVPLIINFAAELIPDRLVEKKHDFFMTDSPLFKYVKNRSAWNIEISLKYHIAFVLLYFCMILLLFSLRSLLRTISANIPDLVADYSPVIALLLLPVVFVHGGYWYDFSELLLTTLCLIALLKSQWLKYYLFFALAVLNKELSVLIFVYFLIVAYKFKKKELLTHSAIHAILGGGLFIGIHYIMAKNPGHRIEYWLPQNIIFWLAPRSYFLWYNSYGPGIPFPRPANIILIILNAFLIFYKWRSKPQLIRRMFIGMGFVMLPLFLCFGWTDEVRALYILFPPFFILVVFTIWTIYFPKTLKLSGIKT